MKKNLIFKITFATFITAVISGMISFAGEQNISADTNRDIVVSGNLFSITLPEETKGLYKTKKSHNGISVYDKVSEKAGFGGFAFGIEAYANPEDYSQIPSKVKLGELTDKKGNLYDIVLIRPTDVQFDYEKGECKSYNLLYELAETIDTKIRGIKGAQYFKGKGMHGEDLYKDILAKHRLAIEKKWNSSKLEAENMSYMYNVLNAAGKNVSDITGYAYYDVNGDGIDELFIGEIAKGDLKGVIYDIYTIVNRKPVHVVSGGARNRFFVCDDSFICNEYSGGANASGMSVYFLTENSTELFPQVHFIYNGYKNKNKPWFISYGPSQKEYENVSEKVFKERRATFERYKRFDFIPLSR